MKLFGFHILSQEDYNILSGEIERLNSLLEDSECTISELKAELVTAKDKLISWQSRADDLKNEKFALSYELCELKDQYSDRETEC